MLQGAAFEPFLTPEILEKAQPIHFRIPGGSKASGYRAEILPVVCEIYLKARDAGTLTFRQRPIADQADILIRGLATVGIIALVDEATHYQEMRARNALSRILEEFVAKELQAWVKTFPNDYYSHLFRLRGLEYPNGSVRRPQYFGDITNDIVYKRLAPGVLDELKRVTPKSDTGRRRGRYFQSLTLNAGYPKLLAHLGSVVTLMKINTDWKGFMRQLDIIHPRWDKTMPFPLEFDDGKGL